ncbi:MAG: Hpt domain-containing protein [Chromatiaceae bacterium]|jgi:chemosensory pili system protein ChpA (sensor histidine kinase/response regulator)
MMPELSQDRSTLRWIRGELDQTLREARNSLEDFVEGQNERLGECVDRLHHVHGVLEMVQVYGAAMLADEMEQLALALSQGQVKRPESAAEALMLGMVQLPAYLEKIEGGSADIPMALLPLLNDLRAARDAALVTETSLFAPKLNSVIAADTVRPGSGNRDLPRIIQHQRSHYHRGLLNWIRGQDEHAALAQIRDVLDLLNSASGTARLRRLLDAGEALATALLQQDEAPALAVKPLFGKIDRVLKRVMDQGEEAAMLDFPIDVLKNLLYYIARSDSQDPAVLAVKQASDLANAFPEQLGDGMTVSALGGPDRELFQAVGEALSQDLRDVKDQLDLFMRSDRSQLDRLTRLAPALQRIGDTFGMVGRGELRSRLKHRGDELREVERTGEMPSDDSLMALAGDLLLVESSLASLSSVETPIADFDQATEGTVPQVLSEGEMQQHLRAAVDEALVELARIKDSILEYLNTPEQNALLQDVPQRLHAVAGALRMLDLPDAAGLLETLEPYVDGLAGGQQPVPDAERRDALADVIISAELYMQSAVEPGGDRGRLLSYAHRGLEILALRESVTELPTLGSKSAELDTDLAIPDTVEAPVAGTPPGDEALADATPEIPTDAFAGQPDESPEEHATIEEPVDSPEMAVAAPSASEAAGTAGELVDAEILEIFSEEAQEELESIQRCYPQWRDNGDDVDALTTMRRSFHTLKGSGRIVGATKLGEFAWSVENLLNRVIDGTVEKSPDVMQVMDRAVEVLPELVAESLAPGDDAVDVSPLSDSAFALASSTPAETATGDEGAIPDEVSAKEAEEAPVGPPTATDEPGDADLPGVAEEQATMSPPEALPEPAQQPDVEPAATEDLEAVTESLEESILTTAEGRDSQFAEAENSNLNGADSMLSDVFLNEAKGHLQVLADFIEQGRREADGCTFDDDLRRAMHTLRGSSRTAQVHPVAELAAALENLGNTLHGLGRYTDAAILALLERGHAMLSDLIRHLEDPSHTAEGWQALCDEIAGFVERAMHEGELTETEPEAPAAAAAETGYEHPDPELLDIFLEEARELLEALENELVDWQETDDDQLAVAQLQRTLHTMKGGARLAGITPLGDISHALESVFESVTEQRIDSSEALRGLVQHATDALAQDIEKLSAGTFPVQRPAMIERLEAAARGQEWEDVAAFETAAVPDQQAPPAIAELAVAESSAASPVRTPEPTAAVPDNEPLPIDDFDTDSELLSDSQLMTDSELLVEPSLLTGTSPDPLETAPIGTVLRKDSNVVQFPAADQPVEGEGFVPRRAPPQPEHETTTGTERVRVSSDALDQMVNNAGEVSIYRARIEQQNSSFSFNLGELSQTIDRLRSQLRDLELETEAQILSRHEREGEDDADFDPLELDRYSTIQQLSRALSETVEDLSNLGQSLNDLSRDTDTLLLQQARVNTDLQDSLLRTRMVKFSSRVPRLERVVRQTSHGLGKQAALVVKGGEEDMDRAILERMMSPLEHLLRNAVSHGLEDSAVRLEKGKPAQGSITLHLVREGSDVVLTLSDDGAGLDRERIRAKAVERGLMEADAAIEDEDLFQMILKPGFSTASELSQVSGRGVGMDVVLTEVKQLGGTLEIASNPGQGTSFTIRLPFTLAITDALLVTVGDDIFAIPHSSMDGVVRVPVDELRRIYAGEQEGFHYNDRDYSMRYLGSMLGMHAPHLSEGARWLPLLLVRSGEHRVAIQVDSLMGNRQIVVKSIGAQLSSVRWFTGGTILADGQIALILDVNRLVRMDGAQQPAPVLPTTAPVSKGVSVMVVDDSITVRKVTTRLLERHNMHVLTAKDGVDAVTVLQEHHPDVMLLDIEMPRMDGYELARHMRSTPELSDIPIIMITSRSGDKHRNRALELGVKRYLGKPYQEADLLENIYTVLADTAL